MTNDDIIRMAHEAGDLFVTQFGVASATPEWLERFAAIVTAAKDAEHQQTLALQQRSYEREIQLEVEAEREACAEVVDGFDACDPKHIAAAIRARGNT